jgi:hypothetical protein
VRANAIDGHYCAADGRVMTIEGPRIPGGNRIGGDYSRHAYVLRTGESRAGATVRMILLDEETVNPGNGAEDEIWHRCERRRLSRIDNQWVVLDPQIIY